MKISVQEARRLVQKGMAHMTCPPQRIPSDTAVDAPLLGNGDLGATIAGDGFKQVFYLGDEQSIVSGKRAVFHTQAGDVLNFTDGVQKDK